LRARRPDLRHDGDIVGAVACQPVELVDDDVVDAAALEAFQHARPCRAASRGLAGLAPLDELADYLGVGADDA
jgi:hypothetical protein